MTVEKSKISVGQFMFSIACFIHSSSLLSSFFVPITKQDSWLAVIFGIIVCLPVLWVYCSLAKAFPDLNLIQINDKVFGCIIGKIISAIYVLFFLTLTSLNLRDLGIFVNKSIMSKTPFAFIIVLFILLCAWSVYYGLEVVTRYSILFVIISSIILLITIIATLNLMHFDNFLPILHQPIKNYIQSTHIISVIPFGELITFLMITPNIDTKPKKLKRYFFGGFLIGGIVILIVILRDTAVLGNTLEYFALPSFETLRLASLFKTISHMEILFAILLIILLFFKITFIFYVSLLAISHMFHIKTYRPLILPCAAIIVTYSIFVFNNIVQHFTIGRETVPFIWTFIEILLPLFTLIIAYIKKAAIRDKNKSKEPSAA